MTVLPSDVFLVSYPRSGNTWLRFLVANVLEPGEQATFPTITRLVPDIYDEPNRSLRRRPSPRVLKSHEPYDARYGRVVYLVRHPADVAVSYYHYLIKMQTIIEGYDLGRFVDAFVAGSLDEFGTWGDHVTGWLDARERDHDFVFLRYEDVLGDAERALRRVLALLGRDIGDEGVQTAVERSSAGELRRIERETANELPTFRSSRPDKSFIRRATAGTAADELPAEQVAQIVSTWRPVLDRVGYVATPDWREGSVSGGGGGQAPG